MKDAPSNDTAVLPAKPIAFIWFFVCRYKWSFLLIGLLVSLHALTTVFWPLSNKLIIEAFQSYINSGQPPEKLMHYVGWVISLYIIFWFLGATLFRIRNIFQSSFYPKFRVDIQQASLAHLQKHSYGYYINNFAGSVTRRLINLGDASFEIMKIFFDFLRAFIIFLATFALFFNIHWIFAAICITWATLHLAYCLFRVRKWNLYAEEASASRGSLIGSLMDSVSNIYTTKVFAREKQERAYLFPFFDRWRQRLSFSKKVIQFDQWALSIGCIVLMLIPTFICLIHFFKKGLVSVGDMVFILAAVEMIIDKTYTLGDLFSSFSEYYASLRRGVRLVDTPVEVADKPDAVPLDVKNAEIAFHDVTFSYDIEHNHPIFKDLSLTIQSGEKVGIVGASGTGKSTLIHLILRYFDVDTGMIRIDGQDIKDVTQESLRQSIAFIPQDTTLFHRTIGDNIRFGRSHATQEEVIAAAKKADAHTFIEAMPDGYETIVGERGVKLSVGQRQRISIARAILKDSPILILDEATASLDSETEQSIQNSLGTVMHGRTSIAIAHRLSTLRNMDRIIVLQQGKIVEEGSHASLLRRQGVYAKLWSMQSDGFIAKPDEHPPEDV